MEQLKKMKIRWLNYDVAYVVSFCGKRFSMASLLSVRISMAKDVSV